MLFTITITYQIRETKAFYMRVEFQYLNLKLLLHCIKEILLILQGYTSLKIKL